MEGGAVKVCFCVQRRASCSVSSMQAFLCCVGKMKAGRYNPNVSTKYQYRLIEHYIKASE